MSQSKDHNFFGRGELGCTWFCGAAKAPHCPPVPGVWLGWAVTEAGEESQGVKVKCCRLALPKEVAGSEMKVGDESAQR